MFSSLNLSIKIKVYLAQKIKMALLNMKKILNSILAIYLDFVDIFLKELATKLGKRLEINKYTINLEENKQLLYKLIYSFKLFELKTPKTNTRTNLANSFLQLFKSSLKVFIFFIKKLNSNFYICIYYQGLNNINLENKYLLLPIGELFNQLILTN